MTNTVARLSARAPLARHRAARTLLALGVTLACLATARPASATLVSAHMTPIPSTTNQASLTLTIVQSRTDESVMEAGSSIDMAYDTVSHQLTMTDADLTGSDVLFDFGVLNKVEAKNIHVTYLQTVTPATVNPADGTFTGLTIAVTVSADVYLNGSPVFAANQAASITLSGKFTIDQSGVIKLVDFTGPIAAVQIPIGPFTFVLTGNITLNVQDSSVTLDPVPGVARVGGDLTLTGQGFTPGTVLKIFVATSGGVVDVAPSGISPTSVSADGLVWNATLPWPWPVAAPNDVLVGNGFADMYLVRTDVGFTTSNDEGVVLLGNPNLDPQVPSITAIDGTALSATSSDTSIATSNVEDFIVPGNQTTIDGSGFANPVVNIFSASGNCAPPGGIVPSSSSSTSLTMTVPANCPIGPGSVQVINATGSFLASNAVSTPIGELVTISSVEVNGATITVNGTGFNSLTVINLFAGSGGNVVNAGGLAGGNPKIPLTIVTPQQFTFTRPDGLDAGNAFIQAINPPFIPFTNSGTSPAGSFVLP
ncbi:MAG: hypothetical protein IPK07_08525 [Deltaproteobacteria bacterium]|nr:hypothetical protein [Deltaproteobacteria bacterium]